MTPAATKPASLDGLPLWVRAAAVVGIPGLIAVYLVWVLGSTLPARLDAHVHKLDAHAQETREAVARQIHLLSQICNNTADTAEERAACWTVRP